MCPHCLATVLVGILMAVPGVGLLVSWFRKRWKESQMKKQSTNEPLQFFAPSDNPPWLGQPTTLVGKIKHKIDMWRLRRAIKQSYNKVMEEE